MKNKDYVDNKKTWLPKISHIKQKQRLLSYYDFKKEYFVAQYITCKTLYIDK